ncbi:MAG: radical SAM protein [Miltoncostaeaceae bacterium]
MTRGSDPAGRPALRWPLADEDAAQGRLIAGPAPVAGTGELAGLELYHVRARTLLNRVPDGSRMPFRWTINAYRGCSHACAYCFARPTHAYLGLDTGEDFDRRLVVKVNAVDLARAELAAPGRAREPIAMGTNTDPYQPVEGRYRLTRGIVDALADAGNPFSILTKSTLITRDIDLLAAAARRTTVHAALSIGTLDREVWRATEPHAPDPRRRMEAVAALNAAGVPCGVMLAPVIPGLSDDRRRLDEVVRAAVDAGAVSITPIMLHLRDGVREHYLERLGRTHPEHATRLAGEYVRGNAPAGLARDMVRRVRESVARHGGPGPEHEDYEEARFGSRRRPPAGAGGRGQSQLTLI